MSSVMRKSLIFAYLRPKESLLANTRLFRARTGNLEKNTQDTEELEVSRWLTFQQNHSRLISPYFHRITSTQNFHQDKK